MATDARRRIIYVLIFRAIIATAILGFSVMVQMAYRVTFPINPLFAIIIFVYLADLLYLYLMNYVKPDARWFIYLQIVIDLICESLLIYLTGGIESALIFLYILSIICASILLLRKGAVITASLCGVFYLGIAILTFHEIVPLVVQALPYTADRIFYVFFLNVFGFYMVAFLSSHLSVSLKTTGDTLRRKNARFEDLKEFNENVINCLSGGLITTDLEGKITFVNQSAEDITGYHMAELIDKNVRDLFGKDGSYVEKLGAYFNNDDNRIYRYEQDFLSASKAELFMGISVTRLVDKGRHSRGYIFIFQDLTDLKKLEDEVHLKEKMIALGEMAAKIAHEIRNPLASISGSVQLLKNEMPLEGEQTNLMEIILKETGRLNKTLENFLAYSRPQKSEPRQINLSEVFLEAMLLLKNSSELRKTHHLNYNLGAEDIRYFADPNQMKQIFWNLSSNAIKAMPGGGTLEVGMNQNDQGDILIEFNDEGVGMGEEDRKKLFQPFHGSFTGGTGLGLSIVYQIIKNHFGKIDVESEVDRGTRVRVHLPGNVV